MLVDNVKVGDHSPCPWTSRPGRTRCRSIRDGYVRTDQNVDVRAGQRLPLAVNLEPSPDTGFELTSEPPGGLVWLDGAPIKGASGQQARTDFRAFRIPPGTTSWRSRVRIAAARGGRRSRSQPGAIQKVTRQLLPASGGGVGQARVAAAASPRRRRPRPAPGRAAGTPAQPAVPDPGGGRRG